MCTNARTAASCDKNLGNKCKNSFDLFVDKPSARNIETMLKNVENLNKDQKTITMDLIDWTEVVKNYFKKMENKLETRNIRRNP